MFLKSAESLLFLSKTQKNYFVVCFPPPKNYCISKAKSEVSADDTTQAKNEKTRSFCLYTADVGNNELAVENTGPAVGMAERSQQNSRFA